MTIDTSPTRVPDRSVSLGPRTLTAAQAEKTAKEFEAVFLSQAFKSMFENVSMGSFGSSHATETWKSFLGQEYAKTVAETGVTGISQSVASKISAYTAQENKNG